MCYTLWKLLTFINHILQIKLIINLSMLTINLYICSFLNTSVTLFTNKKFIHIAKKNLEPVITTCHAFYCSESLDLLIHLKPYFLALELLIEYIKIYFHQIHIPLEWYYQTYIILSSPYKLHGQVFTRTTLLNSSIIPNMEYKLEISV